jgi:queuine tRNA-ribosyltransferase
MPHLPSDRPNHLLGIGDTPSIADTIPLGIDTFDSSFPTRAARHGSLLTPDGGHFNITRAAFREHFGPPVEGCSCSTCQNYSAAYLHHLFRAYENTAMTLASIHNLHTMVGLMANYRQKIADGEI